MKRKIVLASGSPRRKEILSTFNFDFQVKTADIDETYLKGETPADYVLRLSRNKALAVADKLENALVIGADTIVVINNKILGKPKTPEKATEMLKILSGWEHSVLTAVAVVDSSDNSLVNDFAETKVFFRKLTDAEIAAYVKTGEPLDKAGAYGIQGFGACLIEKIHGDYFNVVGLPINLLYKLLQEFNISLLD